MSHTYSTDRFTEPVAFFDTNMHYLSLSLSVTHTHAHHPIFKSIFSMAHFLPPLKMTVADTSTHSEGKRADISSWVMKLGSIILLCQGSLDFFLPDLTFGVHLQDTNFCFLSPSQPWTDSLYVFWMQPQPVIGSMFSLSIVHTSFQVTVTADNRLGAIVFSTVIIFSLLCV